MEPLKKITIDLSVISEDVVEILLIDSTTDPAIFDEIAQANTHRPEILQIFLNHLLTPETTREFSAGALKLPVPSKEVEEEEDVYEHREKTKNLLQRVQNMKMGEKMQLAFKGSREIRSILLRDPSKEIMVAVLNNPKISDSEVELMAKQKTSSVDILREISKNRNWVKTYSIVQCLVSNPKTPTGIAIKHINKLRTNDLKIIEKDRNIPEAVRANAKRLLIART